MSFTLTLANGVATSSATSAKTVTEMANIARLVVADKAALPPEGLTAAATNQYYMDALRDELVSHMRREAAKNRLRELESQQQAIKDQAVTDTAL